MEEIKLDRSYIANMITNSLNNRSKPYSTQWGSWIFKSGHNVNNNELLFYLRVFFKDENKPPILEHNKTLFNVRETNREVLVLNRISAQFEFIQKADEFWETIKRRTTAFVGQSQFIKGNSIQKEPYGKYAGSHAQSTEGLSDDFIDNVLGGEPDAYWNID